jgi:hypothetical protein
MTMGMYRRLWWSTLLVILVPSVVLGVHVSPIPALVIAVTVLGTCAGAWATEEGFGWRSWGEAAGAALLVAAAEPAFGRHTLPFMIVASATSPPALRAMVSALRAHARTIAADSEREIPDITECLASMSGAEICELWSRSFSLVKSATGLSQRLVGMGLRDSILDELERRDSAGLARWLAHRPSAASEPRWVTDVKPRNTAP